MNVMYFLSIVCSHCIIVSVLEMLSVCGVLVSGLHQQISVHICHSTICIGLTFFAICRLIFGAETIHVY